MIRFYLALLVSKFIYLINRIKKDERNDFPGLVANKICPKFLEYVKKPKLVITITGTNGKTTTSTLINNKLVESGMKVSFNDWGANLQAGYTLVLLRSVNIFNKVIKDAAVLEADEKTLAYNMGMIKPNYILVTNICKDSLRRNAHPEYIFNCINNTFKILGSNVTAILNANDPISSRLALDTNTKIIYYKMCNTNENPFENIVKDICLCPKCKTFIKYNYRNYRHIGDFYCENCDFKSFDADFYASKVDYKNRNIEIIENGEKTIYPLISDTIFNAYNVLSAVTLLRTIGIDKKNIATYLETQKVPEIRETCVTYNNIEYYTYGTKSQNVSAASTIFEYMAKEPSIKELVFCLDEVQDDNHPTETLTWLYETDYEFLNSPNIKKIVIGGHMYLNHKLRLLLAGVPDNKIVAVEDEKEIPKYIDKDGIEKVYVLFEIDCVTKAKNIRDAIVLKAKEDK